MSPGGAHFPQKWPFLAIFDPPADQNGPRGGSKVRQDGLFKAGLPDFLHVPVPLGTADIENVRRDMSKMSQNGSFLVNFEPFRLKIEEI